MFFAWFALQIITCIKKQMERDLHRLENTIATQSTTLAHLRSQNTTLHNQISSLSEQNHHLRQKLGQNFPTQYITNEEIIKNLEAKLSTLTWQNMQLQKMTMADRQTIATFEDKLLLAERELLITKHQLKHSMAQKQTTNDEEGRASNQQILTEWKNSLQQKSRLAVENHRLRQKIQQLELKSNKEMMRVLAEMQRLVQKIQQNQQQQQQRNRQINELVRRMEEENLKLREELQQKNQSIVMIINQCGGMTSNKASDLHTIKNLRRQLRKKGEIIKKILHKFEDAEQAKKKFEEFSTAYEANFKDYRKIADQFEQIQKQNTILKLKYKEQEQKIKALKEVISEQNKKLVEILIENQACHELLFEVRGKSNLFRKDVEEKVKMFLKQLQRRRSTAHTWVDVSELVEMNQRLRTHRCKIPDYDDQM